MVFFKITYYFALISLLGNNSFKTRESANRQLELIGQPALPFIDYAYRTSKDLEIQQRCYRLRIKMRWEQYNNIGVAVNKIMSKPHKKNSFYAELKADELLKDLDKIPWIDSLSVRFPDRDRVVAKYLMLASDDPSDHKNYKEYPRYRRATRLLVIDLIDHNVEQDFVRRVVRDMVIRSKGWNGGTPLPQDTPEDNN